jgi:CRISPR/Cas system-associated endonuclease Cas3-HD
MMKTDETVKSEKDISRPFSVLPAPILSGYTSIQYSQVVAENLDPVLQRGDDSLARYQN